MLSEPQRCSLRTGAPLKSSLRQCKIGSGVAIDRTQGIHKLLRAFDVFEERAQAKDRKQRAFMRFQLGQCINSLAQLLDAWMRPIQARRRRLNLCAESARWRRSVRAAPQSTIASIAHGRRAISGGAALERRTLD